MFLFDVGIKVLLILTFIFFIVFFFLNFFWSEKNILIATMNSLIYSFKFLLIASLVFGAIFLIFKFWPNILQLFSF